MWRAGGGPGAIPLPCAAVRGAAGARAQVRGPVPVALGPLLPLVRPGVSLPFRAPYRAVYAGRNAGGSGRGGRRRGRRRGKACGDRVRRSGAGRAPFPGGAGSPASSTASGPSASSSAAGLSARHPRPARRAPARRLVIAAGPAEKVGVDLGTRGPDAVTVGAAALPPAALPSSGFLGRGGRRPSPAPDGPLPARRTALRERAPRQRKDVGAQAPASGTGPDAGPAHAGPAAGPSMAAPPAPGAPRSRFTGAVGAAG